MWRRMFPGWRSGLTGHACELMQAGTDICGLRAASVRNGSLLAGRAALCMSEWMEGAGL